jgi:LmbE family N-acetylglucosaminyl deacetylase
MNSKKILAIFAHPDDEAFGTGGSLSHFAAEGHRVSLICATRGEVGEISDPSLATPETLGDVREGELRCAAETMGIVELILLDYRDSGMLNSAGNQDPRAFINAPAEKVVYQLVECIRRIQPDVIVTFEPHGGYGHPDHIAIHRHTVTAFHAASDPSFASELGNAWQTSRLFYTAIPRSFFLELRGQIEAMGGDSADMDWLENPDLGWPDEEITVVLDVSSTVDSKWEALNCHRTQFGPANLFRRIPENTVKILMSKEHFLLAWPEPTPGLVMDSPLAGM